MDASFCDFFGSEDNLIEDTAPTNNKNKNKNKNKNNRAEFVTAKSSKTDCFYQNEYLPPEVEVGNVEYKLKLINPTPERMVHLVTQMKWRLREGRGEAIYQIGVEDNGLVAGLYKEDMDKSLETLKLMADRLDATTKVIRRRTVETTRGQPKISVEVHVRKVPDDQQFIDVRIAVTGHMDVGKSSLIGVLTHGEKDNGQGRARLDLFRHLHEIQSGRTSSISQEIMGFDKLGNVINYSTMRKSEEICQNSCKLITFIDLAGHPKYMKTTVFGLTGHHPDIVTIVVSAISGAAGTFNEHLSYALALRVPLCIIVNKTDLCSKEQVQGTVEHLVELLKQIGVNLLPLVVKSEDDASIAAAKVNLLCMAPIFTVSSVSGDQLDYFIRFLNLVSPRISQSEREIRAETPVEFHIDDVYSVQGIGTVLEGYLKFGLIREGDWIKLGPTECGSYKRMQIHSIHRNRSPCRIIRPGQVACIAIKGLLREHVRTGMVMLGLEMVNTASLEFEADTYLIYHTSHAITAKFQLTVHVNSIRQQATVVKIEQDCLESGKQKSVRFIFNRQAEYLLEGSQILFREGKTKGIGTVTKVYPINSTTITSTDSNHGKDGNHKKKIVSSTTLKKV